MLERILGSKAKVRILRALAYNPNREFTIQEVAKETGLALGTAHPAIRDLVDTRAVLTRKAGRSIQYKINASHLLYAKLLELFEREIHAHAEVAEEFVNRIGKKGVKSMVLFGSVARGEYRVVGDVDILIVTKDGGLPPGTEEASQEILDKYDTIISPLALSSEEVRHRLAKFDSFILGIADEGKLLWGDAKWLKK